MKLFDNFFPPEVVAYNSGRKMDFMLPPDQDDLTPVQKDFLSLELGFQISSVATVRQVHGNNIIVIDRKQDKYSLVEADGLITELCGVPLAIRTADCVPIFVYDVKNRLIGLFHAGWKSTKAQILIEGLKLMQQKWQTQMADVKVALGPCIHRESCEVKEFFKEYFPQETFERDGKLYLDLPLANKNQALTMGVREENILDVGIDTFVSKNCFSYRRGDVEKGRMLSLIIKRG